MKRGIKNVIIAGGTGAVNAAVEEELKKDMQIKVQRLRGDDRYLTALAIARHFEEKDDYERVVLATGENFADALSGAPFAAKYLYPVLLTGKKQVRKEVLDYIGDLEIDKVHILGGEGAISEQLKDDIH